MGESRRSRRRRSAQRTSALVVVAAVTALAGQMPADALVGSPPGAPELVAPVSGHVFDVADPQTFTLRATDADGDRWVGVIEVLNTGTDQVTTLATPPTNSGGFAGTVSVPPLTPGQYTWRAHAVDATGQTGPWSDSSAFSVGTNSPPGPPTPLSPADGAALRRAANEPFSVSAVDANGDAYSGEITIRTAPDGIEVARFSTSLAPSGGVSSGVLFESLAEGSYTWSAEAEDVHGARSGPSASRSFTVNPPPTVGGGITAGTAAYTFPGVPLGTCEATSAALSLSSAVAVVNTALVGFVGPVELTGTTTSACESVQFATGTVSLDIRDTGTTDSTLLCDDLVGTFTRVAAVLVVGLEGGCVVNDFAISRVSVSAAFAFGPADPPSGLTGRMQRALVGGAFFIRPE